MRRLQQRHRGSELDVDYAMPFDVSYQAGHLGQHPPQRDGEQRDTAQASAADLENAKLAFQSQLAQIYFELHGLDADADLLRRTLTSYRAVAAADRGPVRRRRSRRAPMSRRRKRSWSRLARSSSTSASDARNSSTRSRRSSAKPRRWSVDSCSDVITTPPPVIPLGLPSTLMERRPDVAGDGAGHRRGERTDRRREGRLLSGADAERNGRIRRDQPRAVVHAAEPLLGCRPPARSHAVRRTAKRRAASIYRKRRTTNRSPTTGRRCLTAFQQVEDQLSSLRILEQESAARSGSAARPPRKRSISSRSQYTRGNYGLSGR